MEAIVKNSLGDRLKALREAKGLTLEEVGSRLSKSKQMVGYYEAGKNKPPIDVLSSLAELYEVTISDLIGERHPFGKLHKEETSLIPKLYSNSVEKTLLFLTELPEKDAELYVPYYDIEVTAGRIEMYFDDDIDETPEGYLYAPQYRGCIMFYIKGDSMYDRIFPGARVYVYKMPSLKYIDFGQIFLIVIPGERLLKYIYPHPTDESKVILRSHNSSKFPDWHVEKADIMHLFKIKGYENQSAM